MCSIKAVAMCLQGKGTFHWNQFLFIALPTFNNFSPIKAGRIAWAKIEWTFANILQIPVHRCSHEWRGKKNSQGSRVHVQAPRHTHTHTHSYTWFPCPHMSPGCGSTDSCAHQYSDTCAKIHTWNSASIPVMCVFVLAHVQMDSPMEKVCFIPFSYKHHHGKVQWTAPQYWQVQPSFE